MPDHMQENGSRADVAGPAMYLYEHHLDLAPATEPVKVQHYAGYNAGEQADEKQDIQIKILFHVFHRSFHLSWRITL